MVKTAKGSSPEALATFAKSARKNDGKSTPMDLEATEETAPIPTDPNLEQEAATRVLREGATGEDQGADELIDELPDRINDTKRR
jgi:hypothetical protein